MDDLLESLNTAQKQAVLTTDGPVMVMAGAGSGKTKVLTTRIAYLIESKSLPLSSVLAVTFTNKAALEMKERIKKLIDVETKYMWVSTFHSLCSRLLRNEIHHLPPFHSHFTILDEEDSLKIVKEIMKEEQIETYKPKEIRKLISKAKNFSHFEIKNPQLSALYEHIATLYQRRLEENNQLDFDDLIIKTIELFKKNPAVLEKYQYQFEYILVDEFQDTNDLQYQLIWMLSARYRNLFVVGDDFQSIYSFRGANIGNIRRFQEDFTGYQLILLEQNYRSTSQILNLANRIIAKNPNQIKKKLFTDNNSGMLPFFYQGQSAYAEVMFVIDKIKQLHLDQEEYRDMAILYRANYISRSFEDMLIKYQIPYRVYGGMSFFSRKEIKDMVAYLRLLLYSDDNFSFRRIINEPKRKIGPALLEKLQQDAYIHQCSWFEDIPRYEGKGQGVAALKDFYRMIVSIRAQLDNIALPDLIDILLDETGYQRMLTESEEDRERLDNILEFKTILKETSEDTDGSNAEKLDRLLQDLALRSDSDDDRAENDNCVRLTTFHQAKGLEFNTVFMVAMEEGIFPSDFHDDELDLEEERRICYVGITRAKKRLYLSCADTRYVFGVQKDMVVSRFIKEIGNDLFESPMSHLKKQPARSISVQKQSEHSVWKVGDKLNHKAFGDGMVVAVDGNILSVAFKVPIGIKKLLADHPSIMKR